MPTISRLFVNGASKVYIHLPSTYSIQLIEIELQLDRRVDHRLKLRTRLYIASFVRNYVIYVGTNVSRSTFSVAPT